MSGPGWEARYIDGPAKGVGMVVPADPNGQPPSVIHLPSLKKVLGRSLMQWADQEPATDSTPYYLIGVVPHEKPPQRPTDLAGLARYSIEAP